MGLSHRSLPTPNWTVAYLDELVRLLETDCMQVRGRGCDTSDACDTRLLFLWRMRMM